MTRSCVGPELHLHPARAIPLYFSLVLAIESAIGDGRIALGDTLETVAAMNDRLHLSPGTIRRALRLLEERGIVERSSRTTFSVIALPAPGSPRVHTRKDFT